MYFDLTTTLSYAARVRELLDAERHRLARATDVFFLPDFVTLLPAAHTLAGGELDVWLGAQDASWMAAGPLTGEVSPSVVAQVPGARLVELGHAERRRFCGETDELVVRKALAALEAGLTPLVCVGEQRRADAADVTAAVDEIWQQVAGVFTAPALVDVARKRAESGGQPLALVLAYEPVWAIGAAEPASPEYVVRITQALRARAEPFLKHTSSPSDGAHYFDSVRIIYGGSAGPGTFAKIQDGVDGLFLGRFAHDPERFVQTVLEVSGVPPEEAQIKPKTKTGDAPSA